MTYRLATGDKEGRATHWFAMFQAMTWEINLPKGVMPKSLQQLLDENNAHADASEHFYIGDDLIFETEGDALKFVMMWTESEAIFG